MMYGQYEVTVGEAVNTLYVCTVAANEVNDPDSPGGRGKMVVPMVRVSTSMDKAPYVDYDDVPFTFNVRGRFYAVQSHYGWEKYPQNLWVGGDLTDKKSHWQRNGKDYDTYIRGALYGRVAPHSTTWNVISDAMQEVIEWFDISSPRWRTESNLQMLEERRSEGLARLAEGKASVASAESYLDDVSREIDILTAQLNARADN